MSGLRNLIIVTADHETGGLSVLNDNGLGNFPDVEWTAYVSDGYYSHTDKKVPVYIYSDIDITISDEDIQANTDIYNIIKKFMDL